MRILIMGTNVKKNLAKWHSQKGPWSEQNCAHFTAHVWDGGGVRRSLGCRSVVATHHDADRSHSTSRKMAPPASSRKTGLS